MAAIDPVDEKGIRELLAKGWLTHDAMWFYSVYRDLGVEKTNDLNLSAIKALAPIEVARLQRFLGIQGKQIDSFEALDDFMKAAFAITLPKSVACHFDFRATSTGVFHWEWEPGCCFAFQGMQNLGILDTYRCGVLYRVECWFDALGIGHRTDPEIDTCIMSDSRTCSGNITVELNR